MNDTNVEYRAFTIKYDGIALRLRSSATIESIEGKLEVNALWDTGATATCVSHDVVSTLGLIPTGFSKMQTPSGSKEVNTYLVDIVLPNKVVIKDVCVLDSDIGSQGLGILIGMNIISKGDLPSRTTTIVLCLLSESHLKK